MSSNNRPYFNVKPQASTTLKYKYAICIGAVTSLALAVMMFSIYESKPTALNAKQVSVVKINPLHAHESPSKAEIGARKEIAKTVQLKADLSMDKSESSIKQKRALDEKIKLLKELEDVQLKMALHADDPTFDQSIWTKKQKNIEAKLTLTTD